MKFTLFNSNWSVQEVPELRDENNNSRWGECDPVTQTIKIAQNVEGHSVPKDIKELTRLHELMHAIFITGGYHNDNRDEPLVEWCANCLYSLKKQNKL